MEKSKTTPDAYPMSMTGLATGCNQKNNRDPITSFTPEKVESIVDELRSLGAVTIVQGSGRVTKVRHNAYNWLGLNKMEAALMTELLLRGAQTLGELRTRASRMEPIADMGALQELFDALKQRSLVVTLSAPGRGQIVSHNIYAEWELDKLRTSIDHVVAEDEDSGDDSTTRPSTPSQSAPRSLTPSPEVTQLLSEIASLRSTVDDLATRLSKLEKDLGVS
jgi:uncharacterized protein